MGGGRSSRGWLAISNPDCRPGRPLAVSTFLAVDTNLRGIARPDGCWRTPNAVGMSSSFDGPGIGQSNIARHNPSTADNFEAGPHPRTLGRAHRPTKEIDPSRVVVYGGGAGFVFG